MVSHGPDELFKRCARKTATVAIEGLDVSICEMSVQGRMEMAEIPANETAIRLATVIRHGTPILFDTPVETIVENMGPMALVNLSNEIMRLSGMLGDEGN